MSAKTKIVVIEDSPWFSAHIKRVLERNGCEVKVADNALRGLDVIDTTIPDIIILDMLLPVYNGMALLNELHSHQDLASIPVVVTSTVTDVFEESDLRAYGVVQILDKTTMRPQDILDIVEAIG